jgi:hypothetical protein
MKRHSTSLDLRRVAVLGLRPGGWGAAAIVVLAVLGGGARPAASQTPVGSVAVLEWPAPGDDGTSGRATRYEVRYRMTPLFGADTLGYWTAGTIVSGAPLPGPAGSVDSLVVTGLNPSLAYYFIVRAADEVPNWSGFSNIVVKPAFPDQTPPAVIRDLLSTSGNAAKTPPRDTEDEPPPGPPRD